MSSYTTLVGAEDVRSAGNRMVSAADTMHCAAMNIAASLENHQRFMDDWLARFEAVLAERRDEGR